MTDLSLNSFSCLSMSCHNPEAEGQAVPYFVVVAQSCLTLCNPMDCSMPGLPVHHQLLEFTQTMSIESMMPSNHLILCHPLLTHLHPFPASGSFQMSQFFASGGQRIGASTSVLPMNSEGWFPLLCKMKKFQTSAVQHRTYGYGQNIVHFKFC